MNDSSFETELRRLNPTAPGRNLEQRITAELSNLGPEAIPNSAAPAKREPVSIRFEQTRESLLVRCFHSLGWALAGAASAVAVIALHPGKSVAERASPISSMAPAVPTHDTSNSDPEPVFASISSANVFSPNPSPLNDVNALHPSSFIIHPLPPEDSSEFTSLAVTRELLSTEEGTEVEYGSDNTPRRRVRYRYKERHSWINSKTGSRTEIEIPREDVFLKPISIQ